MKQYSFEETTLIVNNREITGFNEEDDCLIMRRLQDSIQHVVGNKGEMVIGIRAGREGEIMIKLLQTSTDNQFFSQIMAAAENGAFVPIEIFYKDNLGDDLIGGTRGYLRRPADTQRGTTPANAQQWSIVVERLDMALGGGPDV